MFAAGGGKKEPGKGKAEKIEGLQKPYCQGIFSKGEKGKGARGKGEKGRNWVSTVTAKRGGGLPTRIMKKGVEGLSRNGCRKK